MINLIKTFAIEYLKAAFFIGLPLLVLSTWIAYGTLAPYMPELTVLNAAKTLAIWISAACVLPALIGASIEY